MIVFRQTAIVIAAVAVFALAALPAPAAILNLGGGWQASWDGSPDDVDIQPTPYEAGKPLFIEKFVNFYQKPSVDGVYAPILIYFQQISPSAATQIVIDDEGLVNSTGVTWTDFHMELIDTTGGTVFDPAMTAVSGGTGPIGFSIAPFQLAVFSGGARKLDIWGGQVPSGTTWTPGSGASDGQLWINVTPGPNNSGSFTLVEVPTTTGTPEPATLSLLALSGLAVLRRRR